MSLILYLVLIVVLSVFFLPLRVVMTVLSVENLVLPVGGGVPCLAQWPFLEPAGQSVVMSMSPPVKTFG